MRDLFANDPILRNDPSAFDLEREEIDYFLDRYAQGDDLTYEQIILGINVPDGLVANLRRWADSPNYRTRFIQ